MECGARLLVDLDLTPVSELAEDVTPLLFNPCLNVVLHTCVILSLWIQLYVLNILKLLQSLLSENLTGNTKTQLH